MQKECQYIPPVVIREWFLWSGFSEWHYKRTGQHMDFIEFLKLRVAEWERDEKGKKPSARKSRFGR
jgi:hypothetical protein